MDNWASHLRHYRKQTDNPKSRVSSRRGFDAYNVSEKGTDCGGYSLYSESTSEDKTATANKDLDRCARLLNDMLTNDQETTTMLLNERQKQMTNAANGRTAKCGSKKGLNKPKEKRLKGILTKKTTAKGVTSKKHTGQPVKKQVKKSLFSDTDSSMKSSVLAPPLNNSDAVKQAAVNTCVVTNPGPVLTSSEPSTTRPPQRLQPNDRPVSPFRSATGPITTHPQQTNRPLYNTRIPSSTPTVTTPSKCTRHMTQSETQQANVLTEVNPHELANRLTGLPPSADGHYNMQLASSNQPGFDQQVENCHHGHSNYLQREISPYRVPHAQHPYLSQEYCAHHSQTMKQDVYPDQRTLLNTPPEKLQPRTAQTNSNAEQLPTEGKPARKSVKSKSKRSKSAERRTVDKSTEMTQIEDNELERNGVVTDVMKDNVEELDEEEESDQETPRENQGKVYVETDPRLHHPRLSPVSRKARLHTLRYLFNELRSCSEAADGETERLFNEIEDNLRMLVPNVNTMNTEYGIEVSLAMQPLRSENANLRRKLRLLEQQVRHRDPLSDEDAPTKPEQDFNVIHLQMLNHTLEKQLREERSSRELLQQQLKAVSIDVNKLSKEKTEMLQVLSHKDNNHIKSQHDWIEEAGHLRTELQSLEHEREDYRRKASGAAHEKEILTITLKEREKEVDRLQDLVSTFRSSMRKLVDDLSKSGPNCGSVGIMDQLNRTLQLGASPRKAWYPVDLTPTRESDVFERFPPAREQSKSSLTSEALKSHNAKQEVHKKVPMVTTPVKIETEPKTRLPVSQPESGLPSLPSDSRSPESAYGLDISETDYLGSPEIRARQFLSTEQAPSSRDSAGFIDLGASTVKGILGPLADRMRNLSPEKQQLSSLSTSETDDLSSVEEDVTLTEHENKMRPEQLTSDSFTTENSRYSVTDYFDKYPTLKGNTGHKPSASGPCAKGYNPISSQDVASQLMKTVPETLTHPIESKIKPGGSTAPTVGHQTNNTDTPVTPQHQLYKGTELDTSLSTIRETDDVMSVTSSAVTTSSVTSIDDREFRHGLANLDANIARIQASLKHVMQK